MAAAVRAARCCRRSSKESAHGTDTLPSIAEQARPRPPPRPRRATAAGSPASAPASAATSASARRSTGSRSSRSRSPAAPGILLYLAAWLVIPDEGRESSVAEEALRDHRDRPGLVDRRRPARAGADLRLLARGLLARTPATSGSRRCSSAAASSGGSCTGGSRRRRQRGRRCGGRRRRAPPARRAGRSLFLPVVGALLAAAGVLGLLEALDATSVDWRIALGAAVVARRRRDRRRAPPAAAASPGSSASGCCSCRCSCSRSRSTCRSAAASATAPCTRPDDRGGRPRVPARDR